MNKMLAVVRDELKMGNPVVMVTILEKTGSAPREAGAKMAVLKEGSIAGTIGGGILEAKAIEAAMQVFISEEETVKSFRLTNEQAGDLGMECGGAVKVQMTFLNPKEEDVIERYSNFAKEEAAGNEPLCIVGAGHVAEWLARYTCDMGFSTTVMDDRDQFANRVRFPDVHELAVVPTYGGLDLKAFDYIIIVTRGHAYDKEVLAQALKSKAKYIGMIGSKKKKAKTYQLLLEEGYTQKSLDQVHCPIGLSIGAQTPEEIAISIVAELIQTRRR